LSHLPESKHGNKSEALVEWLNGSPSLAMGNGWPVVLDAPDVAMCTMADS
jgi:hypothetical protein